MKGEMIFSIVILIVNFLIWFANPIKLYEEKTHLEIEKLKYELSFYKEQEPKK